MRATVQLYLTAAFCCIAVQASSQLFGPQVPLLQTTDDTRDVLLLDLDQDGHNDVIAACQGDNQVVWFKNNGLGGFGPKQVLVEMYQPYSIAVADLDGDTDLDLVVGSITGDSLVEFSNNGSEVFQLAQVISTLSLSPSRLHLEDLNGDGHLDLLTEPSISGSMYWFAGDGSGNFAAPTWVGSVGGTFGDCSLQDMDMDGDKDILYCTYNIDKVGWFENDGTGSFSTNHTISTSVDGATNAIAYDIGNDGDMDVVAVGYISRDLVWFENTGGTSFGPLQTIDFDVPTPEEILVNDVNGDGELDLVISKQSTYEAEWFAGNGNLGFGASNPINTGHLNTYIAVGPIDNIASSDLVVVDPVNIGIGWLPNDGVGNFGSETLLTQRLQGAFSCVTSDVENDGDDDVLAIGVAELLLFRNNGDGSFQPHEVAVAGLSSARRVHVADLDNDSDQDVIIADWATNSVAWYANDGTGTYGSQQIISNVLNGVQEMVPADLNGDGWIDITSGSFNQGVVWFMNNGAGSFGAAQVIDATNGQLNGLRAADLDGDLDLDVVSARGLWYQNNGTGTFTINTIAGVPNSAFSRDVETFDADNDGDIDVAFALTSSDKIFMFINDGTGSFGAEVILDGAADSPFSLRSEDPDLDGDLDLIAANGSDDEIVWYENQGSATFSSPLVITTQHDSPTAVFTADLDGDGDPDLISCAQGDDDVAWYENLTIESGPMEGDYIIGTSPAADYASFTEAIDSLISRGVEASVTFLVEAGTYEEKLHLPAITMLDPAARITFRGQDLDSTMVTLRYPAWATANGDNHMIHMDGMDNVTWEHMTIERYGANAFGNLFAFSGSGSSLDPSKNARIQNCRLLRSDEQNSIMIYGWTGTDEDSLIIQNNRFVDGGSGLSWSNSGLNVDHLIVRDNTFQNVISAIYISGVNDGVEILRNTILLDAVVGTAGTGISINNCSSPVTVAKNRIIAGQVGQMLTLNNVDGTAVDRVKVINNEIIAPIPSVQGIKISSSTTYVDIFHNSVQVDDGFGVFFQSASSASDIRWRNNVISAAGLAFNCYFTGAISEVDHMALHTTGPNLANWGGTDQADLAALQTASGMFTNSIEADPFFVDPTGDLNILPKSQCRSAGGTGTGVVDDINGNGRPNPSGLPPDIGAHEIGEVKSLQMRIMLEGAYNSTNNNMDDDLRANGLVPLSEPYTALGHPWVTGGGETTTTDVLAATGNQAVVDWVIVQLRDESDEAVVQEDVAALLLSDGSVVAADGGELVFDTPPTAHFVAVLHRNHLAVCTGDEYHISEGGPVLDLSSSSFQFYGGPAAVRSLAGKSLMWAGDVNFNGTLQYTGSGNDRDPILQAIGGSVPTNTITGYLLEDVNMDGSVKYTGANNDRDPILQNIGGVVPTNTRVEQMP